MIVGSFHLLKPFAEGGMSRLFLAVRDDKPYAIKILKPEAVRRKEALNGFVRELKILSKLSHPQIPAIVEEGKAGVFHYYAMDLFVAIPLSDFPKPLEPSLLLYFVRKACDALKYIHVQTVFEHSRSKLFHGDVSPSNWVFNQDGNLLLIDFGSASQESYFDPQARHLGKMYYLPPEILAGVSFSTSTDVYSLAVVIYELLTGKKPFEASNNVELTQKIQAGSFSAVEAGRFVSEARDEAQLKIFFNKAFNREIQLRFQTVEELESHFFKIRFSAREPKTSAEAAAFFPADVQKKMGEMEKLWRSWIENKDRETQWPHLKITQAESILASADRRRHPRIEVTGEKVVIEFSGPGSPRGVRMSVVEIGEAGCMLWWQGTAPQEGKILPANLVISEDGIRISLMFRVMYVVRKKSELYVGVEWVGMSSKNQIQISTYVMRRIEYEESEHLKSVSNFAATVDVTFATEQEFEKEFELNIRFGGILVLAGREFELQSPIVLKINHPKLIHPVSLTGTVVGSAPLGDKFQIGVQLDSSEDELKRIFNV